MKSFDLFLFRFPFMLKIIMPFWELFTLHVFLKERPLETKPGVYGIFSPPGVAEHVAN